MRNILLLFVLAGGAGAQSQSAVIAGAPIRQARTAIALSEKLLQQGDYPAAEAALAGALRDLGQGPDEHNLARAALLCNLGVIRHNLGRYHEAVERNREAAHVDQEYLASRNLTGEYADGYSAHNLHFLWASLMMEGRNVEAMEAARNLAATIIVEEARKDRWKELYLPTPIFSMIRFGRWEEMLREPAPPKGLRLLEGMWRLGRGLALVATGRLPGAEGEHVVLAGLTKRIRRDHTTEEKTERMLLKIAERILAGELAARRQHYDDAIRLLEEAVKMEETLQYSEPPLWPLSVRHHLGAVLLLADRPSQAEAVYHADLLRHPDNGWALIGLIQSLRAQQKDDQAAEAEERFKKVWAHADFIPAASRM